MNIIYTFYSNGERVAKRTQNADVTPIAPLVGDFVDFEQNEFGETILNDGVLLGGRVVDRSFLLKREPKEVYIK